MAAGDFSPSQLLQIKLKAEQEWQNSAQQNDLTAQAEAAKAVLENQTARIKPLSDPDKDNTVKITWVNPCAIDVQDCTSDCDIDGDEVETLGKDYDLTLCKEVSFSVNAEKLRTNTYTFDEVVAPSLNRAIVALDQWWAKTVLTKLSTFAGVNVAPSPWTFEDGTTTIPANQYNNTMVANLIQQMLLNKIPSAYFIEKGGLFVDWLNAQLAAGNLDGKGAANRIAQLKMYFDQFNWAAAGISEDLFMVGTGAVAMATKNRYTLQPVYVGGKINQTRYAVQSKVLPGIMYDAIYEMRCVTRNGKSNDVHSWKLKTVGDVLLNPEGCEVTVGEDTFNPTGVLSYTKGS